jgi:hypothetical protein
MAHLIIPRRYLVVNRGRRPSRDLMGVRFGKLVATEYLGVINGDSKWKCACDCGRTHIVKASSLTKGDSKSCGCLRRNKPLELIGAKFGRLTVVELMPRRGRARVWKCVCECGNEIYVSSGFLRAGYVTSCGCKRLWHKTAPGVASQRKLFYSYQRDAQRRRGGSGLEFSLTFDQFKKITSSNCHYCGANPSQVVERLTRFNGHYVYNGIDRVDSTKGYIEDNCVPCCKACNWMKNKMTREAFLGHIGRIYRTSIAPNERSRSPQVDEVAA